MLKMQSIFRSAKTPEQDRFIFIVGFNKTATKSLNKLFQRAGFPTIHHGLTDKKLAPAMMENMLNKQKIFHGFDRKFRVFSDMSLTEGFLDIQGQVYFPIMDRDYPGSLFLFNHRPIANWIRSRTNHVSKKPPHSLLDRYRMLYQTDDVEQIARLWTAEFEDHRRRLRAYFGDAPNYLELDIETDDVPARLSAFVGHSFGPEDWLHLGRGTPHTPQTQPAAPGQS